MPTENRIEELLLDCNAPEDFPGKAALWQRIEAGETVRRRRPARAALRVAVLAAVIMALATTTVFAEEITEGIRQLVSGRLAATAREELVSEHDGAGLLARTFYRNREHLVAASITRQNIEDLTFEYFTTFEEAQAVAPYTLKAPAWLPEGYSFERAGIMHLPGGAYLEDAVVSYTNPSLSSPGALYSLGVLQTWVGPDASVDMEVVGNHEDFQAVTVNGCAGLYTPAMGLAWIEDSVYYEIHGVLALEEMMQIAESLQ